MLSMARLGQGVVLAGTALDTLLFVENWETKKHSTRQSDWLPSHQQTDTLQVSFHYDMYFG